MINQNIIDDFLPIIYNALNFGRFFIVQLIQKMMIYFYI